MRNEATKATQIVQPKQWFQQEPKWRFVVAAIFSASALAAALFVILSGGFELSTQKWAYGIAGMVLGNWLPNHRR